MSVLEEGKDMLKRKEQLETIISGAVILILLIDTIAIFVAGYAVIGVISLIGLLGIGLLAYLNLR